MALSRAARTVVCLATGTPALAVSWRHTCCVAPVYSRFFPEEVKCRALATTASSPPAPSAVSIQALVKSITADSPPSAVLNAAVSMFHWMDKGDPRDTGDPSEELLHLWACGVKSAKSDPVPGCQALCLIACFLNNSITPEMIEQCLPPKENALNLAKQSPIFAAAYSGLLRLWIRRSQTAEATDPPSNVDLVELTDVMRTYFVEERISAGTMVELGTFCSMCNYRVPLYLHDEWLDCVRRHSDGVWTLEEMGDVVGALALVSRRDFHFSVRAVDVFLEQARAVGIDSLPVVLRLLEIFDFESSLTNHVSSQYIQVHGVQDRLSEMSVETISALATLIPSIVHLPVVSTLIQSCPDRDWSAAGGSLLDKLKQVDPGLFERTAVARAQFATADEAVEILRVCGADVRQDPVDALRRRFQGRHSARLAAALHVADLHLGSGADPSELVSIVTSSPQASRYLLWELPNVPTPTHPDLARALSSVLSKALGTCAPSDVVDWQELLVHSWSWLPESCKRLALESWTGRLKELRFDEISVTLLPHLSAQDLPFVCAALQQAFLSFPPAETLQCLEAVLLARLRAVRLAAACLDYCIDHFHGIAGDDCYSALNILLEASGYMRVPLTAAQAAQVTTAIFSLDRPSEQFAMALMYCWSLAANDLFDPDMFERVMSSPSLFPGVRSAPYFKLTAVWEHYQRIKGNVRPLNNMPDSLQEAVSPSITMFTMPASRRRDPPTPGFLMVTSTVKDAFPGAVAVLPSFGALSAVMVIHSKEPACSSATDSEPASLARHGFHFSKASHEIVVFVAPRMSRHMALHSLDGGIELSGNLTLPLANLEKIHGCRILMLPAAKALDAMSEEEVRQLLVDLYEGKQPSGYTSSDNKVTMIRDSQSHTSTLNVETSV